MKLTFNTEMEENHKNKASSILIKFKKGQIESIINNDLNELDIKYLLCFHTFKSRWCRWLSRLSNTQTVSSSSLERDSFFIFEKWFINRL